MGTETGSYGDNEEDGSRLQVVTSNFQDSEQRVTDSLHIQSLQTTYNVRNAKAASPVGSSFRVNKILISYCNWI